MSGFIEVTAREYCDNNRHVYHQKEVLNTDFIVRVAPSGCDTTIILTAGAVSVDETYDEVIGMIREAVKSK